MVNRTRYQSPRVRVVYADVGVLPYSESYVAPLDIRILSPITYHEDSEQVAKILLYFPHDLPCESTTLIN